MLSGNEESMVDLGRLKAEIETLRTEGLRQMEAWDSERRETKRLHAVGVRFRNRVSDLEENVADLGEKLETQTERAEKAEQVLQMLKVRIDELRVSFREYGEHKRECQKRRKVFAKKDAPCTCGYEGILEGGGSLERE